LVHILPLKENIMTTKLKSLLTKLRAWSTREDVRSTATATVTVAIVAAYGAIFYIGRQPVPPRAPGVPLLVHLHIERLLACGAGLFAMWTVIRRLQADQPLLEPLSWMLVSGLVHLSSLAIEFRWL
jgi:hypothetical protein